MSDEKTTKTPEEKSLALREASDKLERIINESGVIAVRDLPPLMQSITLAKGIGALRELLTDGVMKAYFLPMQGTTLGFLTDKDQSGGYPIETVREVMVEGLLRGFRPIGNEMNIISGRFYGAKAGFERFVREYPGLTDLRIELGVPEDAPKGTALVQARATWYLNGVQDELKCYPAAQAGEIDSRIPVRVNTGMGPDAILGKATRKLYARIYAILTGCSKDAVEGDPDDARKSILTEGTTPEITAAPEGRRVSLRRGNGEEKTATHDQPAPREPGQEG